MASTPPSGGLSPRDTKLSISISPEAANPQHNQGLRNLLVRRLTNTDKAVVRVGIRTGDINIFCEQCRRWSDRIDEFPEEWTCSGCKRTYGFEFAVMEEIRPTGGQG